MAIISAPSGDPFSSSPLIFVSGGIPAYVGLAASKCGYLSTFSATNKQVQARSYHVAADNISSLKIAVSNWYMSIADGGIGVTTTEVGSGGNCTVTASIEYPLGTYAQITFSSGSTSKVVSSGTTAFSDFCSPSVTIPRGAVFGIGQYRVYAGNGLYNPFRNPLVGGTTNDQCHVAASGLTDVTMGGTLTDDGVNGCPPIAIIATTRRRSLITIGDSLGAGRFVNASQPDWRQGIICKNLPVDYPFLNLALGGEAAHEAISHGTGRQPLWQYCSNFAVDYYWNDVLTYGDSAATILANIQTVLATLPAATKKYVCTVVPWSDSSDSWQTVVNQSLHFPAQEADRLSFNTTLRGGGLTNIDGFLEVAWAAESSHDSGKWICQAGVPNKYVDTTGVHPTQVGYPVLSAAALAGFRQ